MATKVQVLEVDSARLFTALGMSPPTIPLLPRLSESSRVNFTDQKGILFLAIKTSFALR